MDENDAVNKIAMLYLDIASEIGWDMDYATAQACAKEELERKEEFLKEYERRWKRKAVTRNGSNANTGNR